MAQNYEEQQEINQEIGNYLRLNLQAAWEQPKTRKTKSSYLDKLRVRVRRSKNFTLVANEIKNEPNTEFERIPVVLNAECVFISMFDAEYDISQDKVVWSPYLLEFYNDLPLPECEDLLGVFLFSGVLVNQADIPPKTNLANLITKVYKKIKDEKTDDLWKYLQKRILRWSNHEYLSILQSLRR